MKIVQLHAENFKRLGVVEITPEGNLVRIGGNNGHGKSSVLDAIYVALKGRAVAPPKPVRIGEEKSTIRLDMGDLVVTRTFHSKDDGDFTDGIKVESADGLRYSKPQDVLNALLGEVGFDPFAFVNLKPKEQAARLLEMVPLPIDLDEFAQLDSSDFDNRRDVNRDVARLRAQLEGIPAEDVPDQAPDRSALTDALGNAADTNAGIERARAGRDLEAQAIHRQSQDAIAKEEEANQLRLRADKLQAEARTLQDDCNTRRDALDAADELPEPVDTDAIRAQLRDAEAVLAAIDRQHRRLVLTEELREAERRSQGFTDAMTERAARRNNALAAAEMPVPGLAFALDERGQPVLTYEGLPFDRDQISTAVQLRVSTAIGMAANPRLRVLRISDGSLLDDDSMKMLTEMADAEDFQLWVEVVGDGGVGVVMENGMVRGAAVPATVPEEGTAGGTVEDRPAAKGKAKAEPKAAEKLL